MEQSIYIFSDAVDLQHKDKFDTWQTFFKGVDALGFEN